MQLSSGHLKLPPPGRPRTLNLNWWKCAGQKHRGRAHTPAVSPATLTLVPGSAQWGGGGSSTGLNTGRGASRGPHRFYEGSPVSELRHCGEWTPVLSSDSVVPVTTGQNRPLLTPGRVARLPLRTRGVCSPACGQTFPVHLPLPPVPTGPQAPAQLRRKNSYKYPSFL